MSLIHTPINYKAWNSDGQGHNILSSLSPIERKVWEQALPLQDKRDDKGHAEVSTYFALGILKNLLNIKREIVVPAIILHDIGYKISPVDFRKAFLPKIGDEEEKAERKELQIRIRLDHQVRGTVLAYQILNQVNFSSEYVGDILAIIADHDTRFYGASPEGEIMQDADVLWRVTKPCMDAFLLDNSKKEKRSFTEKTTSPFLHLDISKNIARIELDNTMSFYK